MSGNETTGRLTFRSRLGAPFPRNMQRSLPFIIIGIVVVVFTAGGVLLLHAKVPKSVKIATGVPGAEPPHVRGGAQARVTLEEFGDFQCPTSGMVSTVLQQVEHDYGDKVRVIFREFPLALHPFAFTAACAAESASLQDRFWPMHDQLFEHAAQWAKDSPPAGTEAPIEKLAWVRKTYIEYAIEVGVNLERFYADFDTEKVTSRIKADQARGASLGVDQTPVLFLNGVKIPFTSFNTVEALHKVIDAALAGKPPQPDTSTPIPIQTPSATP